MFTCSAPDSPHAEPETLSADVSDKSMPRPRSCNISPDTGALDVSWPMSNLLAKRPWRNMRGVSTQTKSGVIIEDGHGTSWGDITPSPDALDA